MKGDRSFKLLPMSYESIERLICMCFAKESFEERWVSYSTHSFSNEGKENVIIEYQ